MSAVPDFPKVLIEHWVLQSTLSLTKEDFDVKVHLPEVLVETAV